jgi:transcriptional regulator with GAF, ATPase, and Fis domain
LKEVERAHIIRVLEQAGWRVQGQGGAAEILELNRSTLESRMAKLGIHRPKP